MSGSRRGAAWLLVAWLCPAVPGTRVLRGGSWKPGTWGLGGLVAGRAPLALIAGLVRTGRGESVL